MTTLSDAWRNIISFNDSFFKDWRKTSIVYWTNALAGEFGEFQEGLIAHLLASKLSSVFAAICNLAKKMIGGGTKGVKPTREQMLEEMADTFIYQTLLCESMGFTEHEVAEAVIKKNMINRQRMEERAAKGDNISLA